MELPFLSKFDRILIAIEQPLVALVLSNWKISAISCDVLGQSFNLHEM